ncbi:MAG: 1-(5-phosphoribosyl)-5-[(5-phosphoribosylamino)methylideneamino]imidazole-4-carboxamide isomerase [Candidatus Altiarchaeota archaeon]|nr:1-(5-phosphoribosyl)-5-[(5-phosphoribosylamino)methylideneamino]imidazole-4-carboxamide isomerase [Candidatus Altiarchaeota archaeon]
MKIIPAIDIKDGKCTQLVGGKAETAEFYGDPVETAEKWESLGAGLLHVIDLDAALGTGDNMERVRAIKNTVGIPIQFGGGIRSLEKATEILDYGIDHIILGTLAIEDYSRGFRKLKTLGEEFGKERLVVALDSRGGNIVVKGWREKTGFKAEIFLKEIESLIWGFLYTDVDVEGLMRGINLEGTRRIVESTDKPVIASGGISSLEDIKELKDVGTWGVVLGKALYEGRIDFKEALEC